MNHLPFLKIFFTLSISFIHSVSAIDINKAASEIDAIVLKGIQEAKKTPNPKTTDAEFLRRIYLDVIGRIPTHKEAETFLFDTDANKRSKLIDKLLKSPGYNSHMFNYFADLLRLKSYFGNNRHGGTDYIKWVKGEIAKNTPWNKFVYKLVTAQGLPIDNPAVGYYLRDRGMPLDNMANTAQATNNFRNDID